MAFYNFTGDPQQLDNNAVQLMQQGRAPSFMDAMNLQNGAMQNAADQTAARYTPNPQQQQSALMKMLNPNGIGRAPVTPGMTTPWSAFQF